MRFFYRTKGKAHLKAFPLLVFLLIPLTLVLADHHVPDVCLGGCPVGSPATNRHVDHEILRLS